MNGDLWRGKNRRTGNQKKNPRKKQFLTRTGNQLEVARGVKSQNLSGQNDLEGARHLLFWTKGGGCMAKQRKETKRGRRTSINVTRENHSDKKTPYWRLKKEGRLARLNGLQVYDHVNSRLKGRNPTIWEGRGSHKVVLKQPLGISENNIKKRD